MKAKFPSEVEKGRVLRGDLASPQGADFGMFFIMHPRTRARFKVIASSGDAWVAWDHVSVSMETRCPTWNEMVWIKQLFFEPEECAVEYHPPDEVKVDFVTTCLHLWRPHNVEIPMPPLVCV